MGPTLADATRALEVTQPGIVVGTASYMSPEQARGQEVDGRTDLFSLDVVLYELVTGRKPFGGQTAADVVSAILSADPTPPGSVREGVPADVEAVILKALRKDPALRYQAAGDLLDDLRAARADTTGRERLNSQPNGHGPAQACAAYAAAAGFAGGLAARECQRRPGGRVSQRRRHGKHHQ